MANNTTIEYTAKRRLKTGVSVDDPITLELGLSGFDPTTVEDVKRSTTIDGTTQHVLNYIHDVYNCQVPDTDTADIVQFLYSVRGGEVFTMTNPDDGDRVMSCKLRGSFSRQRQAISTVNEFTWSFTVEDIDT